ncbi:hypothetical protein ACIQLG_19870 [Terribacillus saccharophilus]|uniref:hypothetical protein n=1 Tax=Terribacillus saccharophilus TaxID=361277 RepID=UPI00381C4319
MSLKKGDLVVMHTCMEAEDPDNAGKLWVCRTDEANVKWTTPNVVWLEGYAGAFSVEYLQKVDISSLKGVADDAR